MNLQRFEAARFPVPFRLVFRHASASRAAAANIIVAAHSESRLVGYGEGCPRDYVTGETVESAAAFVAAYADSLRGSVGSLGDLERWSAAHRGEIDANPAAFCAMELAVLDLLGKATGRSLEALLGLPALDGPFRYSAVLGDNNRLVFALQFRRYRRAGFTDFKLKLSGEPGRDQAKLALVRRRIGGAARVRLDANNLWRSADQAAAHLKALGPPPFALEEPLAPGDHAGLAALARACGTRIVLDESLLRAEQLDRLDGAATWIANLRISKQGGLLRAIALARAAADRGIGVIVGAHVGETGILTRAGLTLAQAVRTAAGAQGLVAMEGAYGTYLLARDLAEPSLMFGQGGLLEPAAVLDPAAPGLGLTIDAAALEAL